MRIVVGVVVLLLSGGIALADTVPSPRPRPVALGMPTLPSRPDAAAVAPGPISACQQALRPIAIFQPHAPVAGKGGCGIVDPVTLEAVILRDSRRVAINPPAMLRCDFATAVSKWVRNDVAPDAAVFGAALRGIVNYDSYDCRSRNRVHGATLSEHGRGNALDVRSLELADGRVALLSDRHVAAFVRRDLRRTACSRFMTVLGPGSDGYHEGHVHLDLAPRHNDYRICHWVVREPETLIAGEPTSKRNIALPRPRPDFAARGLSAHGRAALQ